ncbi:MAG: tetratricopeptide repeat protein [bacterium]
MSRRYRVVLAVLALTLGAPINAAALAMEGALARESNGASPDTAAAPSLADATTRLAARDFAGAETLCRVLLAEAEAATGAESRAAADVLDVLVEALWRARKVRDPEARALGERAVRIRERGAGGPGSPGGAPSDSAALARSLFNLATICQVSGDYAAARPLYERTAAIQEQTLGADDIALAATLNAYGMLLTKAEEFASARGALERAAAIFERAEGPESPRVASTLFNLAKVLQGIEDFDGARAAGERALAIQTNVGGPESAGAAMYLNNLGHTLRMTGDYAGALAHYKRSLAIYETIEGAEGPSVSIGLISVGQLLQLMGDYAGARPYLDRALELDEKNLGAGHPQTVADVLALATLESSLGNYEAADARYARASADWEKTFGAEHSWVAAALSGRGQNARLAGRRGAAREFLERALAIRERALGANHTEVATSLEAIAEVLREQKNLEGARAACERALAIREATQGRDHPEIAATLRALGNTQADAGRFEHAVALLDRAAAIEETSYGTSHPSLAMTLANRARALVAIDRRDEAFESAVRAEEIAAAHLQHTARALPEEAALRFEAVRASGLDIALGLAAADASGGRPRRAWDRALRSRGLILNEMAARHRVLNDAGDPEIAASAAHVANARQRVANLAVREAGALSPATHERLRADAHAERDAAERALAARSAAFRNELAHDDATLDDVAAALPHATALVAYCRFTPAREREAANAEDREAYLAFVLRAGERDPGVFPIGSAAEIDSAVARWNGAVLASAYAEPRDALATANAIREAGAALRALIWDPVAQSVHDAAMVCIVPDGSIHLVSFAALPVGTEAYLMEAGPTIHYFSTERDALAPGHEVAPGRGLLAIGGPDFDARAFTAALSAAQEKLAERVDAAVSAIGSLFRGPRADCGDFASLRFEPLPETEREANTVAKIWRDERRAEAGRERGGTDDAEITRLVDRGAHEAAFKRSAPGKRALHIATHGFFLGAGCAESDSARSGWNPLLLSGFALAGANRRDEAAPDDDDGIVTAEEIAALDLSGTEWVVLSGCETGLGGIVASEGVFGLRRAFQIAGARTTLMSLWPVDDESTRRWMTELYRARLERGASTAEAVRAASLASLHELRERGEPTYPFLWGSFIAAGDWR